MSQVSKELQRSKRIAIWSLIIAGLIWFVLLISLKIFPAYSFYIQILLLSAEAGVIGGLADWYAVTVLFRNPFGRLPIPKFLRNHTEILPRNQARIAHSMGRFVQENFLSKTVIQHSLQKTDVSLKVGEWLTQSKNQQIIINIVQQTLPKTLDFISQQHLAEFIKNNTVQWLKNTPVDKTASELLKAVLENDFHQEVFQHLLSQVQQWIYRHPDKVHQLVDSILREVGLSTLAKGASLFGFDMHKKGVDAVVHKIQQILSEPKHPLRQQLEQQALHIMQQLSHRQSPTSQQLNHIKNDLLNSPAVLNFMTQAVMMLCQTVKEDINSENSGISLHLQSAIQQFGENLQENAEVRVILNQRISEIALLFSEQYSYKVIDFISEQIQSWDSSEMIAKIENEVGSDLHMIRVNGVIVGAFIGLILGIIRVTIEYI